jgi:uncharacterized protein (TIGR04255 family)
MYFEKPPLIELIAELRWLPAGVSAANENAPQMQIPAALFAGLGGSSEQLYMRFAGLIGAKGFLHSERLIPQGFPAIPFQPVYRYSKAGNQPGQPIFQLGSGVFSAHITPPYKTWDDFRPFVEIGVAALLEARGGSALPINSATVRYIDCFTEHFLQGLSTGSFMQQMLGIGITVPDAISKHLRSGKEITPAINLSVPLANDRQMEVALANGGTPAGSGLIMNSSVSSSVVLRPELDIVMHFLDGAHQVISDMFVALTKQMHPVMEPKP